MRSPNKLKFTLLLASLTLNGVLSAADVASAEWTQWRGPARDGLSPEKGLLKEWPAAGPTLLWKATGLGVGYSSVSVAGGKIFSMGDAAESSCVVAYDAASGKQLWSTKVGKIGGNYAGTRSTPTVDGNVLYALGQFGDLVCLETATGKELWRKNLATNFSGAMAGWNYTESVLVDGNQVVCTPGGAKGAILALDKKTGEKIWQSAEFTDGAQYSSLVSATIGGVKQYVQLTAENVVGIAPDSGKLLWKAPRKGATAVIPTPIVHNDCVYVTSGYGIGCNLFKITNDGGKFSATEVYANKDLVNHHGGVILVDDCIYGHSDRGGLICMDFKTGNVLWKNPSVGKGSLAYADGHLYLRSEGPKGTVGLIEANPKEYKETGRFDQPDRNKFNSWAHPVVVGGRLYLRDMDNLFCYDVKAK